ncbi:MAG: hypothetical protein FJ148_07740 [Deltaproteobacteria bacterium]|nr:hypothetical protein [Deltaproteobacteria bacterium]
MATNGRRSRDAEGVSEERAGRRSSAGGRPPRVYRAVLEELSARSLRVMWEVVTDPDHPWHDAHGPKMLRDLVRVCTPRIGHVGVFERSDFLDTIEPQPSMAELFDAADDAGVPDRT